MDRNFKSPAVIAGRKLLNLFGVAATYTPATGAAITLRVFFRQEVRQQVEGYEATTEKLEKTIECIRDDLESLDHKGAFTIGGTSYQIVDIMDDDTERITFVVK